MRLIVIEGDQDIQTISWHAQVENQEWRLDREVADDHHNLQLLLAISTKGYCLWRGPL